MVPRHSVVMNAAAGVAYTPYSSLRTLNQTILYRLHPAVQQLPATRTPPRPCRFSATCCRLLGTVIHNCRVPIGPNVTKTPERISTILDFANIRLYSKVMRLSFVK